MIWPQSGILEPVDYLKVLVKIMLVELQITTYPGKDTKLFTYELDPDTSVAVGQVVRVPFGKKQTFGIVRKLNAKRPAGNFAIQKVWSIVDTPALPSDLLNLADWMVGYYVCSQQAVWRTILPPGLGTKSRLKLPGNQSKPQKLNNLSASQNKAYKSILKSDKPSLLLGVTGSGKTEVYLHLIKDQFEKGQSTLLLFPEILLTEHLTDRIAKHFPTQTVVVHSGLTPGKRWALWQNILVRTQTEPLVILGARSTIFVPVENLGQIIIDEEHEPSYKQETAPHYHTRDVAAIRAKLCGARLVLGSATPSVVTRFWTSQDRLELVSMDDRHGTSMPKVELVNMQDSRDIISPKLHNAIAKTLASGKQCLLFLNRRGSASKYLCTHCGYVFDCPSCGSGLHFHADSGKLQCHICDFSMSVPALCPECKQDSLRFAGIGTKRIETDIAALFPDVKILRIDRDSFKPKDLAGVAKKLQTGEVDIIIGTQMIGRGLDLPKLHLVGVILADTELGINDYSSAERAFQLISQAAGRAGRREIGQVIIQTYRPDNPVLQDIVTHDYNAFYEAELKLRRAFSYPPYGYLLKLTCGFARGKTAETRATELVAELSKHKDLTVLGPVPAYPPRSGNKFRYQLIVKSAKRASLHEVLKSLPSYWTAELDPLSLL